MKTKKYFIALISALIFATPLSFAEGEPENVTGIEATAVDQNSITLSWDVAKDANGGLVDHYSIYYGTTSIQTTRVGDYDFQIDTSDNNTSCVISDLTANTAYYFSITAIDSNDIESDAYSLEASATTVAEEEEAEADTTSPTVVNVTALDKIHVVVEFSETVKLPEELPEMTFTVAEQINSANLLEVKSAVIDTADTSEKTVKLETAEQAAETNYIVTAGVAITDTIGNPIISGDIDSGIFIGSSAEPIAEIIDCGTDDTCFDKNYFICTPAKLSDSSGDSEIKQKDENTCLVILVREDKEMQCEISMNDLSSSEITDADKFLAVKDGNDIKQFKQYCTGTLADVIVKKMEEKIKEDSAESSNSNKKDCEEDIKCFTDNLISNTKACTPSTVTKKVSDTLVDSIAVLGQTSWTINEVETQYCMINFKETKTENEIEESKELTCEYPLADLNAIETTDNKEVQETLLKLMADNCPQDDQETYQLLYDKYTAYASAEEENELHEAADTTPPEDVSNLVLTFKKELDKFVVLLDWTASIDTAKDLIDQILYMSLDRGITYDEGRSLGTTATHAEVEDLEGGQEYTFKIATRDTAGNESVGTIKSIRLPETGAGMGLLLIGSAIAAGRALRRKK